MDYDEIAKLIASIRISKDKSIGPFTADMIRETLPPDSFFYATPKAAKDLVHIW